MLGFSVESQEAGGDEKCMSGIQVQGLWSILDTRDPQ